MGSKIVFGFPYQGMSAAFYGGDDLTKPPVKPKGRRSMSGGPLLPKLPRNPFATAARRIGTLSTPRQPQSVNRMF